MQVNAHTNTICAQTHTHTHTYTHQAKMILRVKISITREGGGDIAHDFYTFRFGFRCYLSGVDW